MARILVLRTSTDFTIMRLFKELDCDDVDCLIQSSQLQRYRDMFPNVRFIDIKSEGFYDIPYEIISSISNIVYDQIYIAFSGFVGHNYGNVVELVNQCSYRKLFFYNCDSEKIQAPQYGILEEKLILLYMKIVRMNIRFKNKLLFGKSNVK